MLDQQRDQEQQTFFFSKFIRAFHDQLMERAQVTGDFFIRNHVARKSGKFPSAGHFFSQVQHDLFRDVKAPVVQGSIIALDAGVIVAGVEQENIALCDGVLLIFAGQHTLPILHKSDHIVFMEMVWEGLNDPLKAVSLDVQFVIVDYRSYFFLHAVFLLVRPIIPARIFVGL